MGTIVRTSKTQKGNWHEQRTHAAALSGSKHKASGSAGGYLLAVKTFFADARFISGDEENCSALWIKCKGNAPYPIIRVKSKFLHVGVTRIIEGVNPGPSQLGPNCCRRRVRPKAASCTSFGNARNSGSNSSPIRTVHIQYITLYGWMYIPLSVYGLIRLLWGMSKNSQRSASCAQELQDEMLAFGIPV